MSSPTLRSGRAGAYPAPGSTIDCYDEATDTASVWSPNQDDVLADDWEVRD